MPKRKGPALDNQIARDIFSELELYAKDRQFYPLEHALYSHMVRFERNADGKLERRYNLIKGVFRYWFSRLVEEGYIEIDKETRAIRATHLIIVEKDKSP